MLKIFSKRSVDQTAPEKNALDAVPVFSEEIDAEDFLKVLNDDPDSIASVRFVPPKIGDIGAGFGKFSVNYLKPKFAVSK